jgi:hypothetical protein
MPIIVGIDITIRQIPPNARIIALKPLAERLEYACINGWGKHTQPRDIAAANPNTIG